MLLNHVVLHMSLNQIVVQQMLLTNVVQQQLFDQIVVQSVVQRYIVQKAADRVKCTIFHGKPQFADHLSLHSTLNNWLGEQLLNNILVLLCRRTPREQFSKYFTRHGVHITRGWCFCILSVLVLL